MGEFFKAYFTGKSIVLIKVHRSFTEKIISLKVERLFVLTD